MNFILTKKPVKKSKMFPVNFDDNYKTSKVTCHDCGKKVKGGIHSSKQEFKFLRINRQTLEFCNACYAKKKIKNKITTE